MEEESSVGRPRKWDSDAERKAAKREEAKRVEQEWDEYAEQRTRDLYGYTPSETRTKAERDAAAERMLAKHSARS